MEQAMGQGEAPDRTDNDPTLGDQEEEVGDREVANDLRKRFEAAPKIVVGGIAYVDKVIAMMIVADAARYIESMTKTIASKRFVEGLWPANDPRRAFVEGAKWWEYTKYGATMWPSDRDLAEAEAEERAARGDWS